MNKKQRIEQLEKKVDDLVYLLGGSDTTIFYSQLRGKYQTINDLYELKKDFKMLLDYFDLKIEEENRKIFKYKDKIIKK
jgi:hypothetical protein